MIPQRLYGRPLGLWVAYSKLPLILGGRLYILKLDEVSFLQEPFTRIALWGCPCQ